MYWHIDTDIVSLIVIAAIYVYQIKMVPGDVNALRNRRFLRCLQTGIVITIIDIAASIVMEVPTTRFLYHLLMTLYYISIELVIVEWFFYSMTILFHDDEKRFKRLAVMVHVPYVLYSLLVCTNPWTGLFFSLGPDNAYQRGPCFFLMVAVYVLITAALFVVIIVRWKHIPKGYPSGVLLMVPIILMISVVVQLANYGWLMILPGYMICLVLAFLFLQTMRTKDNRVLMQHLSKAAVTDTLTGLLNRSGMESMLQQTESACRGVACLVLLVDIDDLKGINDTMGHAEGDRAIQSVAARLKQHFRASDIVARYGGDEFLVYLAGELSETQSRRSLQQLLASLSAIRIGENDHVPLHCSIGAEFGVVGRDDFEQLISHADAALYHVKRCGKNSFAFYRPEMETEKLCQQESLSKAPVS